MGKKTIESPVSRAVRERKEEVRGKILLFDDDVIL